MCRFTELLLVTLLLAGASACPAPERADRQGADSAGGFAPSEPIPAEHPLLEYAGLRLGINAVALAQVYNAPEGQGDGFTRVIEDYDAVQHHTIAFEQQPDQPSRKLVVSFYRDRLFLIVDRRDGLTAKQADEWFAELAAQYGEDYTPTLPTSQWRWGDEEGLFVLFTRDNASESAMSATLMLVHWPTRLAAHSYLEEWERTHEPAE